MNFLLSAKHAKKLHSETCTVYEVLRVVKCELSASQPKPNAVVCYYQDLLGLCCSPATLHCLGANCTPITAWDSWRKSEADGIHGNRGREDTYRYIPCPLATFGVNIAKPQLCDILNSIKELQRKITFFFTLLTVSSQGSGKSCLHSCRGQ